MSEYVVAIDLGSAKIAGMVAQKDSNGLLKIVAIESEKSAGVRLGAILNHTDSAACVGRLVKKLQNRAKIEIGQVYVGLSGHSIKSKINVVPEFFENEKELTDEDKNKLSEKNNLLNIENAIIYEIVEQEFLLDGEPEAKPSGCFCSHVEAKYLLVLGKKELDNRICSCIERIPQKLAGVLTSPIVMSESLISLKEKELGCVCIDFGAETTTVVVFADNFMRHIAVIPFGGKTVTKDIMDLQVTFVDAENLKKRYGCALVDLEKQTKTITLKSPLHNNQEHKVNTRNLAACIQARMDEIMDMVCMEIQKSGYAKKLRAGIVITGGASQLKGLPELIELKTGLRVRHANFDHLLSDVSDSTLLTPEHALLMGLVNFANANCVVNRTVVEQQGTEIKPVEPPKRPKKGNKIKAFTEKIGDLFFNDSNEFDQEKEL